MLITLMSIIEDKMPLFHDQHTEKKVHKMSEAWIGNIIVKQKIFLFNLFCIHVCFCLCSVRSSPKFQNVDPCKQA